MGVSAPGGKRRGEVVLSLAEARRIALAAQGFDRPRPKRVTTADIGRVIRRLGLVQLDFVNVLVPAHYLVLYSRLGAYKPERFDEAVYRSREFTEQWAHEASIIPMETWPLLRHRMEAHRVRPWGFEEFLAGQPDYVQRALDLVRERGPLTGADLPDPEGVERRLPGTWFRSVARAVLEAHFGCGRLASADRRPNFARVYDLAERVVPHEHLTRRVTKEEAQRELLRQAVRALGVATAADLADYFRMPLREAKPLIEDLGLTPVTVEGWREPAFLDPRPMPPKRVAACSLLSPFDPLVWFRPRARRLFAFDYTLEIYTPQHKRKWGYYVLPFLMEEQLAARVDLKADRDNQRLEMISGHLEQGHAARDVTAALMPELQTLARWLGLEGVEVPDKLFRRS